MKVSRTNFVWILYFVTLTILLLDTTDNVPGTRILRLIKYPFIAWLLFENITYVGLPRIRPVPVIFMGLLTLHTVLFGLVLTNPAVADNTRYNFSQLMILFSMVFLSARFCHYTKSHSMFIKASFFAHFTALLWMYITHLNGFAPIRYLFNLPVMIMSQVRYGFTFGTGFRSYIGNYASVALILCAFLWLYKDEFTGNLKKYHSLIFAVAIVVFGFILVSSAARSEIISTIIFFAFFLLFKYKDKLKMTSFSRFILYLLIVLIVFLCVYTLIMETFSVGSISNRTNNWAVNIDVFNQHGNTLAGLGYADVHAFLNDSYGYDTWACDVYYLYIFFSSGILGSIIMGAAIVWMSLFILFGKTNNRRNDTLMKALVIAVLFNNMYHCTFNSYLYVSSLAIMVLFVLHLYDIDEHNENLKVVEIND